MEQEKKPQAQENEQSNASHHKKHRHKSYFIDPNAPTGAPKPQNQEKPKEAPKAEQKPVAPVQTKEGQSGASSNRRRNRHRNRNKNRPAQANSAELQATQNQSIAENPPAKAEQKNNASTQKNNKQNHRRGQDTMLKDNTPRAQNPSVAIELPDGEYEEIHFPRSTSLLR